jgi:opacity protein-like surface antigen
MKRKLTIAALGVALCTCFALPAQAQMQWTDKGFFNVTFGAQAPNQSLTAETTPEVNLEPARFTSTQDVAGGVFFEFSAGYKVWRNLAAGIGYSRVSSSGDLNFEAEIPDPDFFDNPRLVSATIPDAHHSQNALHLTGTWMMPVTDKVDVGFQFGPTIFFVSQDLPGNIQVTEPGPVVVAGLESESKTTMGIHLGVDATYLVTPRIGVGGLFRYVWGSADFGDSSESLTLGGLQIGVGLRYRF